MGQHHEAVGEVLMDIAPNESIHLVMTGCNGGNLLTR